MALISRGQITISIVEDGADGRSVTSTDVEFAQSSSATTAPTMGWQTTSPTWVNGSYIWQRVKTIFSTSEINYSPAVNVTGQQGDEGRGVVSITEQYYLSTSKESLAGGSWSDTSYTWSSGKYIWTRSKITYSSGVPLIEYTEPYCDSSWEAVNEIQVGGVNLLATSTFNKVSAYLNSLGVTVSGSGYGYTDYIAVPSSAKSIVASGASNYGSAPATCYYDSNKNFLVGVSHNVYSGTSDAKVYYETIPDVDGIAYMRFSIYSSYIGYTMLEFGNTPSSWRESPIDLEARIEAAKDTNLRESIFGRTNTTSVPATPTGITGIWKDEFYEAPPIQGARYTWMSERVKSNGVWGAYSIPSIFSTWSEDGAAGEDGVGVTNIVEQYYLSTSKTTLSGGSWQSTNPTWSAGNYLWIRTQVTYSSNKVGENPTYTEPYCDSSWEAIEGVQIGGVNYANGTSGDWSKIYSVTSTVNYCVPVASLMLSSFEVGDGLAYRLVVRLTNIVNVEGTQTSLILQGSGNVTGWTSGTFPSTKIYPATSEIEIILGEKSITEAHLQNGYFGVNLRVDNVLSGNVEIKEFMAEKGNTHSSWRPSESDVQSDIADALQVGEAAQSAVDALDSKLDQTKTDIENTLSDGLQESDRLVFQETKKSIETAQKELVSSYSGVYNSQYLEGTPKSDLLSSYGALCIKYSSVISRLSDIISSNPLSQIYIDDYNNAQYPAYDVALDLYSGKLANANSAIQQKLNDLSAGYVDDLVIGGVNLIDYTRSTPPSSYWSTAGWSSIKPVYDEAEDSLVLSASNGWQTTVVDISHIEPPFTISFRYKPKSTNLIGRTMYYGLFEKATYTPIVYKLVTISNEEWVSASITYTETPLYFGFNIRGIDSQGELYEMYLRNLMVEYGNKATYYQESPSDVSRNISNAQAVADAITEKAASEGWATKLTYIDSTGIFTGELSANTVNALQINASQITAGTIDAARIDTVSLKSTLITASNINALSLDVVRGNIGGWSINSGNMTCGQLSLNSASNRIAVYGSTSSSTSGHRVQFFYNTDTSFGFYATNSSGTCIAQLGSANQIAGWQITSSAIYKNSVYLSSDGSIYNSTKWKLANDGSGYLANSNISWDTSGNVTFGSSVSLNWTAPISDIQDDIESNVNPKITKLTSTGIYTGTLTATQVNAVAISASSITTGTLSADRIASGSITATHLDATSIKSSIINTDYINGLTCTFTKGTIGGWNIENGILSCGQLALNATSKRIAVYGASSSSTSGHRVLLYYTSDTSFGFYATNSSGSCIAQIGSSNQISGWNITNSYIYKNSVYLGTDGSIYNGTSWKLANDGSGLLASGNISWDANGNVTFSSSVSLQWSAPILELSESIDDDVLPKLTKISSTGIYTGTLTATQVNAVAISATSITTGTLSADRIAAGSIYASKLNAASIQSDIINATYINGLTCTFTKGTIGGWSIASGILSSGQLALNATSKRIAVYGASSSTTTGHRVQLYYSSDTNFGFYATNSSGSCIAQLGSSNQISGWQITSSYIYKNSVYLGSDGSIYNGTKWKLNNDGSGLLASGNISWDANGNVSFSSSVSLQWSASISEIEDALGGSSYSKLTNISSTGIYTGTLTASQITAGTISASRIDTASIKTAILTATNINALTLTTTKGTIGGWSISSSSIYKNTVYFGSDGSIYNGTKWKLNYDGSGQLAGGNISWDTAGSITAKNAIFSNVRIQGSVRNPFVLNDSSIWIGGDSSDQTNFNNYDNIVAVNTSSWSVEIPLPWTLENSGRRITLVNYKWSTTTSTGYMDISAPTGQYFYEDGIAKSAISFSRECIELLGYGDNSTFFGWIVLNRINLMTTSSYGKNLRVLAYGKVTGTASTATITYKTFDNTTMSVSRMSQGKYRVAFSSTWGLSSSNALIMLTGYGYAVESSTAPIKATLYAIYTSSFYVNTSDDNSGNDGSFYFQITNMNDWTY